MGLSVNNEAATTGPYSKRLSESGLYEVALVWEDGNKSTHACPVYAQGRFLVAAKSAEEAIREARELARVQGAWHGVVTVTGLSRESNIDKVV